uniref:Uncharacterized protein n=1 Tax=Arundo donax TaxID=35708 RepID=A0A0A9FW79_ARUDO
MAASTVNYNHYTISKQNKCPDSMYPYLYV